MTAEEILKDLTNGPCGVNLSTLMIPYPKEKEEMTVENFLSDYNAFTKQNFDTAALLSCKIHAEQSVFRLIFSDREDMNALLDALKRAENLQNDPQANKTVVLTVTPLEPEDDNLSYFAGYVGLYVPYLEDNAVEFAFLNDTWDLFTLNPDLITDEKENDDAEEE